MTFTFFLSLFGFATHALFQPVVLHKINPHYTAAALDARCTGTVILQLVVDVDGKAKGIAVVKGLGFGLDERAIEAVVKWEFAPGTRDGKPVPVYATIEVNFDLVEEEDEPVMPVTPVAAVFASLFPA